MNRGFTLIELLVVVLIISILSAIALPQYQTAVERARATEALTQMSAISDSLQRYHSQHESWPTMNAFNRLDIDIPTRPGTGCLGVTSETTHGGKHFCLSFFQLLGPSITVQANRSRSSHSYILVTTITPNADGTYSVTRSCRSYTTNDSEATEYCNAISGGSPSNF